MLLLKPNQEVTKYHRGMCHHGNNQMETLSPYLKRTLWLAKGNICEHLLVKGQ